MPTKVLENVNESTDQEWSFDQTISGNYHTTSSGSHIKTGKYRFVEGGFTPNYHKLLKAGQYFFPYQPWTRIKSDKEVTLGHVNVSVGNWSANGSYLFRNPENYALSLPEDIAIGNPDFEKYVRDAMSRAYTHGHDSLTFLAEFAKVITMFKRLIPKLAGLVRDIGRGKVSPEMLAEPWLEWRYGWRLLIYDIEAISDELINIDFGRRLYSERAGDSWTETSTEVSTVYDDSNFSIFHAKTDVINASYRGAVSLEVNPPSWRFNGVVTAWELVPFSFVLDWFWDVGSALEAMSTDIISSQFTAAHGIHITAERTVTQYSSTKGSATGQLGDGAQYHESVEYTKRIPSGSNFNPQYFNKLDPKKVADLLSLFVKLTK